MTIRTIVTKFLPTYFDLPILPPAATIFFQGHKTPLSYYSFMIMHSANQIRTSNRASLFLLQVGE